MEKVKRLKKKRIILISAAAIMIIAAVLTILTITGRKYEFFSVGLTHYYSVEDMKTKAPVIVQGEVTNISEPFLVEDSYGTSIRAYRDFEVKVNKALRGEPGETVTVRLPGGEFGNVSFVEEPTPKLEENEEYILFIYQHHVGGGTLTKGDYYFILGELQGVYEYAENTQYAHLTKNGGLYFSSDILPVEGGDMEAAANNAEKDKSGMTKEAISLSAFEENMMDFNKKYPANEFWFREEAEANSKLNLESGMITQEEYDRYKEQEKEYGRILSEEECKEALERYVNGE